MNLVLKGVESIFKRPLVLFLFSFLFGMVLFKIPIHLIILISFILFLLFFFLFMKSYKNLKYTYLFLLILPILFLYGALSLKSMLDINRIEYEFDEKVNCTVSGVIEIIEEKDDKQSITLSNVKVTFNNKEFTCKKILAVIQVKKPLKIGNEVLLKGSLYKFIIPSNEGQFNESLYYKIRTIEYKLLVKELSILNYDYSIYKQFLYDSKVKMIQVYQNILPEKEAAMITAMIVGDKGDLDNEIKELYQKSGISHIIAISGLHVTLLGISFYNLLKFLRIPTIIATIISIFILYSYGILTNFSVSTNRAVVMLIVFMLGKVIGRSYDLLTATSLSALIILCQSPLEIFDIGFLLSFGAILAIAIIEPVFSKVLPVKNKLIKGLYVSISVQLLTLPISLYYFYEIPTYGILVNIIVIPLSSILILLGAISGLVGCIYLSISKIMIGGVYVILRIYEYICTINLKLPFTTILIGKPTIEVIVSYYIILAIILILYRKESKKRYLLLFLFLGILFIKPNKSLDITVLDVGQGDSIFMMTPTKKTYLIDGGSKTVKGVATYRIIPFLKSKGIWKLDYVFITHMDEDHISGILEIMDQMKSGDGNYYNNRIKIDHLIIPRIHTQEETYHEVIAQAYKKGIKLMYIDKGDMILDKELAITCYHPIKDYIPNTKNSYSLVLDVNFKKFNLLLTGDVEGEGEEELIQYLEDMNRANKNKVIKEYDILKVSHHGSKYSTPVRFLELVKPKYSIISYGKNNTYGHPHKDLLGRLSDASSTVITTSDLGAITIRSDGNYMSIKAYRNK